MEDKEFKNLARQVREVRQLAEENHETLEKVYSSIYWQKVFSYVYWFVIIGIAIGAFYFLQPLWDNVMAAYDNIMAVFSQFSDTATTTSTMPF